MNDQEINSLACDLFSRLPEGHWFIVDKHKNIEVGAGLVWSELYHVLLQCGLIVSPKKEKQMFWISTDGWDKFISQNSSLDLRWAKLSVEGYKEEFFCICRGQPVYPDPSGQFNKSKFEKTTKNDENEQLPSTVTSSSDSSDPSNTLSTIKYPPRPTGKLLLNLMKLCSISEVKESTDTEAEEETANTPEATCLPSPTFSASFSFDNIENRFQSALDLSDNASVQDIEWQIKNALALDLSQSPRLSRDGLKSEITLHDRGATSELERYKILFTAMAWGYADETTPKNGSKGQRIAYAACHLVSYDHGFKKVIGYTQVSKWLTDARMSLVTGNTNALRPKTRGRSPKNADSQALVDDVPSCACSKPLKELDNVDNDLTPIPDNVKSV